MTEEITTKTQHIGAGARTWRSAIWRRGATSFGMNHPQRGRQRESAAVE